MSTGQSKLPPPALIVVGGFAGSGTQLAPITTVRPNYIRQSRKFSGLASISTALTAPASTL